MKNYYTYTQIDQKRNIKNEKAVKHIAFSSYRPCYVKEKRPIFSFDYVYSKFCYHY